MDEREYVLLRWGWGKPGLIYGARIGVLNYGINVQEVMELNGSHWKTNCECHHLLGVVFSVSHGFLLKQNSSLEFPRNLFVEY